MSIGFTGGGREFNTTTASAPHDKALPELLGILTALLDDSNSGKSWLLKWNRDPEEYDFVFGKNGGKASVDIFEYPTGKRDSAVKEKVFGYEGNAREIAAAFHTTFSQMREDIDIDAFEQNWHQKFPETEFKELESKLSA
jgi:hypothetical protein